MNIFPYKDIVTLKNDEECLCRLISKEIEVERKHLDASQSIQGNAKMH